MGGESVRRQNMVAGSGDGVQRGEPLANLHVACCVGSLPHRRKVFVRCKEHGILMGKGIWLDKRGLVIAVA